MPNGINTISPALRDYLLNKNLILSDTITNNSLSGYAVGLGREVEISTYPESVQPSTDIMINGPLYRDLNVINNPYGTQFPQQIDITTDNIQYIGNLPLGTPQSEYPNIIGSKVLDSDFTISSNEAREQILFNKYQPTGGDNQYIDLTNNVFNYSDSNGEYLNTYGKLNVGGPSTTPLNVLGSVLSGGGIGLGGDTNFDVRSSLAGRILGATGLINDTPLGIIGGKQLLLALGNKVAFNAQRETLGKLNLNPFSLANGNDIIIPNYSITVGNTKGSKILDNGLNILGIENPFHSPESGLGLFKTNSSIFNDENNLETRDRINNQILNTGRGQITTLFSNLNRNTYRIGISDELRKNVAVKANLYIFDNGDDGIIDMVGPGMATSNFKMTDYTRNAGFKSLKGINIGEEGFTWAHNTSSVNQNETNLPGSRDLGGGINQIDTFEYASIEFDKKTILGKTKELFRDRNMTVMVSRRGLKLDDVGELDNEVKVGADSYISRGSGVKSKEALTGKVSDPSEIFCRSWSSLYRYNQVESLQKSEGLNNKLGVRNRNTVSSSVLDDNGFVRITPYIGDGNSSDASPANIKKFMFSLENLAWSDQITNLPVNEMGPGDPVTGTKGRIMWFPPYDLKFSEDSSLNWDTHDFIGRGEPLYTYNHTERSGQLSFKVLMDHPSYMNDMRGYYDNDLFTSIAAGCSDFDLDTFKNITKSQKDVIEVANVQTKDDTMGSNNGTLPSFTIYFPNDVYNLRGDTVDYERYGDSTGTFNGLGTIQDDDVTLPHGNKKSYPDTKDYGLNKPISEPNFWSDLKEKLNNGFSAYKINITGYASFDGVVKSNTYLADKRAKTIKVKILQEIFNNNETIGNNRINIIKSKNSGETGPNNSTAVDSIGKKEARKVVVTFEYDVNLDKQVKDTESKKITTNPNGVNNVLSDSIKRKFFNEAMYFDKLKQDDKLTYDSIGEKIKFFHPAFHSITPEGFNSRLTFLQQCTRQGPTTADSKRPDNLAFGRAPVCILRVGDFYHTKIIIENIGIDYDTGNGVQWDLNPEGVGVQPMIANVTMSFKFIGGSSLDGPINKLQNAVSFNFFANTEIYDPRATYIKKKPSGDGKFEYINDEYKFKNLVDDAKKEGISDTPLNKDQIGQAVIESGKEEGKLTTTITPDAKILGFELIEANPVYLGYSFRIRLKSEGIVDNNNNFLLTSDDGKAFLSKGLKINLIRRVDNKIIIEEVINYGYKDGDIKGLKNIVDGSYFMGFEKLVLLTTPGPYELNIFYGGLRVQTQYINITFPNPNIERY